MPNCAIGTQVYAVRNANEETVYTYGTGTYAGWHPMPSRMKDKDFLRNATDMIRVEEENGLDVELARKVRDYLFTVKMIEDGKFREDATYDGVAVLSVSEEEFRTRTRKKLEEYFALPQETRVQKMLETMAGSPRIDLDQGGCVFGAECWWRPGDGSNFNNGREVVFIDAPHQTVEEGA